MKSPLSQAVKVYYGINLVSLISMRDFLVGIRVASFDDHISLDWFICPVQLNFKTLPQSITALFIIWAVAIGRTDRWVQVLVDLKT